MIGGLVRVNKAENIVAVDIDGTLVKRASEQDIAIASAQCQHLLKVTNPYDNKNYLYLTHDENIQLLLISKARGFYIKVWSAAGYGHAESIVKALKLEMVVDEIETKPCKHIDDRTDIVSILGPRVFIPKEGWNEV